MWQLIIGITIGIVIGRLYGWMKYHNPEFKEEINLRVARLRAQRAAYEAETHNYRMQEDMDLDRMMRQ